MNTDQLNKSLKQALMSLTKKFGLFSSSGSGSIYFSFNSPGYFVTSLFKQKVSHVGSKENQFRGYVRFSHQLTLEILLKFLNPLKTLQIAVHSHQKLSSIEFKNLNKISRFNRIEPKQFSNLYTKYASIRFSTMQNTI